ncbi:MAG: FlgB family protein [Pseudomonadota bacterium]
MDIERSTHGLKTISKGIRVKPWLKPIEGEAPVFDKIEIFQMAHAMARHAGSRHAVVAQNMANADTPGYKAQDISDFQTLMGRSAGDFQMRATRASHLNIMQNSGTPVVMDRPDAIADPNGNSVSLESEMMHGVSAKRQHDRALAIYRSSMTILRSSFSRR